MTVLPYTNPADASKFASIHSNPPGIKTDYPALIYAEYGKGKVIWAACAFEDSELAPHKQVFARLIRELASDDFLIHSDAPGRVEIVTFHQPENSRYIINLINEQEELPPLPIHTGKIRFNARGKTIKRVRLLPDNKHINFIHHDSGIEFEIQELSIYEMLALEYE